MLAWDILFKNTFLSLQLEIELLLKHHGSMLFYLAISRTKIEKCDDDSSITSSSHEPQTSSGPDDHVDHSLGEKCNVENGGSVAVPSHHRRASSSILPEVTLPLIRAEW